MKRTFLLAATLLTIISAKAIQHEAVDYVSILVGTQSKYELSTGNTYPAIAMPWGMNFWTPQTGKNGDGWTYVYTADKIRGFKQTHQPSPWMNDYGQFSIMPETEEPVFDEEKRASWFSHRSEVAKPYYYKVYLADQDVTTEVSPTERAAIFRFTYPQGKSYCVIDAFDRGSYVKVIPEENKVIGYTTRNSGGVPENFKNYFVIIFDKPITYAKTANGSSQLKNKLEMEDSHAGAIVGFETERDEVVTARVASSFISFEQAEQNLKEVTGKSFATIKEQGRQQWNDMLGRFEATDDNIDNLRTFYSCLYRSLLFPRKLYEVDSNGKIVHYSPYDGNIHDGYMFADTGFWDTFRSLFPLLNLAYPTMAVEMQKGLVNDYLESGFLPEWSSPGHRDCMVGNNSASVVADAYLKGLRGYDTESLWKALVNDANNFLEHTASGRRYWEDYNKYGYVPREDDRSCARTLEYAYNDWTIYQFGKAIGKSEAELAQYKKNALNYRNIYNAEQKLMVGRHKDGTFNPDFKACDWSRDFCEGNSLHWSFCVFHDPQGLINLMGGKQEFVHMLDTVFTIPGKEGMKSRGMIHEMREMQVMNMGQYAHGNQPIQHMPYLYGYAGEPWKTQYWVRRVMNQLYSPLVDGYCGDEDNGQTSAWYVFSAMGFYPVCPGSNQYVLGTPLFKDLKLHLENGKTVSFSAPKNSEENYYVDAVKFNGKNYTKNYFDHTSLINGAKIEYTMSNTPNHNRGIKTEDEPYSFSK